MKKPIKAAYKARVMRQLRPHKNTYFPSAMMRPQSLATVSISATHRRLYHAIDDQARALAGRDKRRLRGDRETEYDPCPGMRAARGPGRRSGRDRRQSRPVRDRHLSDFGAYKPGAAVIPGHPLCDALRSMPKGVEVDLRKEGAVLRVKAGALELSLECMALEDYPEVPMPSIEALYANGRASMPSAPFLAALDRVAYAISSELTRYYLNGVYLHQYQGQLRAVATDGHRMSIAGVTGAAWPFPGLIVPAAAVRILRKLLKGEGVIDVAAWGGATPSRIEFQSAGLVLVTKLIDGDFPDYERVLPSCDGPLAVLVTFDRAELVAAVKQLSHLRNGNRMASSTGVRFDFAGDTVRLSGADVDVGAKATIELACEHDGSPFSVGFKGQYLLDALTAIDGAGVVMRFTDRSGASPVRIEDPSDDTAVQVLMSMRT